MAQAERLDFSAGNHRTARARNTLDESSVRHAPGLRLNGSIIDHGSGYLFAFRTGWKGSDIYLQRLDAAFASIGTPVLLDLKHEEANYGREDPRLFRHNGQLHVSFTGVRPWESGIRTSVLYARITDALKVEAVYHPRYPGRNTWEKNWAFFSSEGELYAVYSIFPHRVLHVSGDCADTAYVTEPKVKWKGEVPRGGASPVLVDGLFWHFFHDRVVRHGIGVYRMGLYAFSSEPPFEVMRWNPEPILAADVESKPKGQYAAVVFPAGAVHRDGKWLVSYGVHDRHTDVAEFRKAELERECRQAMPPRWWAMRPGTEDLDAWVDIEGWNGYGQHEIRLTPGDLVIDVGAHIGTFSQWALRHGASVVAVEPEPENAALLRRNLAPWRARTEIVEAAIAEGETVRMQRRPGLSTVHWETKDAGTREVPATTFDSVAAGRTVRLLKLDCEGCEWDVFRSDLSRVEQVVGEYHPRGEGKQASDLRRALESQGFTVGVGADEGARYSHFYALRHHEGGDV